MFIHTNCFCRLCAGRNMSTFTGHPVVSPLSPSFHHRIEIDSPPSPLSISSRRLSISNSFSLPSPTSPLDMPFRDLPLSPISPWTPASLPWSPTSEYSTESATSDLSIAELTAGDFPSPNSPYNTEFLWDVCVIPSVPCRSSVFAAEWRSDGSCPFTLPAKNGPCETCVSPTTLSNGRKAICSAAARATAPPLPPRTMPKRPLRSPFLASRMSWSTASPGLSVICSPRPLRVSEINCAPIAQELRGKAGPCSISSDAAAGASTSSASDSVSAHTLSPTHLPLAFTNTPWWSMIPAHTYSHSSTSTSISSTSFSASSSICKTPSIFYRKANYNKSASPAITTSMLTQSELRYLYWDCASSSSAAEYFSIFGVPVERDEFAWIRYPVPGPHDLCCYDDNEDEESVYDDDESAGYTNWHDIKPTTVDISNPFGDFDGVFVAASSAASSVASSSPFNSACYANSVISTGSVGVSYIATASICSSSFSGVTNGVRYAMTCGAVRARCISGTMRARCISAYPSKCAVAGIKEICHPAHNIGSIDQVVGGEV